MHLIKKATVLLLLLSVLPLSQAQLYTSSDVEHPLSQSPYIPFVYGPVKRADRLWRIAQATRPSTKVTIQQMMLALFNKNRLAFATGNINSLKRGARLHLPSLTEVNRFSPHQAERIIAHHNSLWRSHSTSSRVLSKKIPKKMKSVLIVHKVEPSQMIASHVAILPKSLPVSKSQPKIIYPNLAVLEKNVNQTAVDVAQLKTAVEKRLQALEAQEQQLENQVQQGNHLLSALTNMVADIDKTLQDQSTQHPASLASAQSKEATLLSTYAPALDTLLSEQPTRRDLLFFSVLTSLLFMIGFMFLYRRGKQTSMRYAYNEQQAAATSSSSRMFDTAEADDQGKDEEEYDYWGSREGVLAKLDLARAYIDMGEPHQAKEALHDVIQKGSDLQKEEARHLLSTIENNKAT